MYSSGYDPKSMMEEEQCQNDSSLNYRMNSRNFSSREQSISFLEQAKLKLNEYNDIDDNDFEIIDENEEVNYKGQNKYVADNYMRYHNYYVPIGTHFQAQIPDLKSSQAYINRHKQSMNRIQALKVSDPQSYLSFETCNMFTITEMLGERNYDCEDLALMKKCYEEYPNRLNFQDYLRLQKINTFWKEYFAAKDKNLASRGKKKKKKNKGTIPV